MKRKILISIIVLFAATGIYILADAYIGDALVPPFSKDYEYEEYIVDISNKPDLMTLSSFVLDQSLSNGCEIVKQNNGDYRRIDESFISSDHGCWSKEFSELHQGVGIKENGSYPELSSGIFTREIFRLNKSLELSRGETLSKVSGKEIKLGKILSDNETKRESKIYEKENSSKSVEAGEDEIYSFTLIMDGYKSEDKISSYRENNSLNLCEGSEGFIQSNRNSLDGNGFRDEGPIFPLIKIEKYGKCSD